MRIDKDSYYLLVAKTIGFRCTCLRRAWSAVLVKDDMIISTGYAGSPRGWINCRDTKECLRKDALPGTDYDKCRSVHAEVNVIINAARAGGLSTIGSTLYLYGWDKERGKVADYGKPCYMCRKVLANAGVNKVIIALPENKRNIIKIEEDEST